MRRVASARVTTTRITASRVSAALRIVAALLRLLLLLGVPAHLQQIQRLLQFLARGGKILQQFRLVIEVDDKGQIAILPQNLVEELDSCRAFVASSKAKSFWVKSLMIFPDLSRTVAKIFTTLTSVENLVACSFGALGGLCCC